MTGTTNIPDAHRCRHETKGRDGRTTQCTDLGMWVHDETKKTWRPANPTDRKRRCWLHGPATSAKTIGRARKTDKPNERLQRYAALVLGVSTEITTALREVHEELSMLGFPSSGGGGSNRGSTRDDGPVSRDAIRIHELTEMRETLRDRINDPYLDDWLTDVIETVTKIRRRPPAARDARLCAEHQQGREGSIAWGDATCTEIGVRDGLCSGCWQRERRWRRDNGLNGREEPAA